MVKKVLYTLKGYHREDCNIMGYSFGSGDKASCIVGAQHKCTERRDIPGSVAFVPSVAGLIIAGEVVKDLCGR